jgi:hypothetical protein
MRRHSNIGLLGDGHFLGLRHVPQNDMVVGFFDAWMPGVVVEADVIDVAAWRCQVSEILLRIHVFQRHHVDGADQVSLVVIGEERTFRECLWVDISVPRPGTKSGSLTSVLTFLYQFYITVS